MRERTCVLTLRVTPQEAALIRQAADAALMTVSAYLRAVALRDDAGVRRLQSLQAELRRQGGLLKLLSNQGVLAAQDSAQALADWRRALRRIEDSAHARQGHRP